MTMEENKALLRQFIDRSNARDETRWEELCAPEFVMHLNVMPAMTMEQAKQAGKANRAAFPDQVYRVEEIIAEGDRVAARYSWKGTHQGVFQGIPPTGKQVTLSIFETDRIFNGKFVETWLGVDFAGLIAQLGVVPASSKQ